MPLRNSLCIMDKTGGETNLYENGQWTPFPFYQPYQIKESKMALSHKSLPSVFESLLEVSET